MFRKAFILLFLHVCNFSFSQEKTIDSLKLILKKAQHDTVRCKALLQLSEQASDEEWPLFNDQLFKLAEKNAAVKNSLQPIYQKYLAHALNNKGYIVSMNGEFNTALEYYLKSEAIQTEIGDKYGLAATYNNLGSTYQNLGDISKAIQYLNKSLIIQHEIGNIDGEAISLSNIGSLYHEQGNTEKAIEYNKKSLALFEKKGKKNEIATTLNNIALVFKDKGDIPKALEYFHKSLKILEELGNKRFVAGLLNNIGNIYVDQGEKEKALEYHSKSLKIQEEIGDKLGMSNSLTNIGKIYEDQEQPAKALEYNLKSLKLREEIGDQLAISTSLNHIADLYYYFNKLDSALNYNNKSLKISEEIGYKEGLANSLQLNGVIFYKQGNLNQALTYALKSMKTAQELGYPNAIKRSANLLKLIYLKQNNFKDAYKMFDLELQMRDSINNLETQKSSIRSQMQYAYETKERELKNEQEKKDILVKEEQNKQRIIKYSISTVLVLVMLIAIFIYRGLRQKQRDNKIITEQKQEVEKQKIIIEAKHKEITDSINYAERIQRSFMATGSILDANLNEYFILFKPKEIVSGDFYWASKLNNDNFIFVTADSTGHGVPGAIMSLLNITSLEKAIETETSPDKILNVTRKTIIERLKNDGSIDGGKDGMDCSLISINKEKTKLQIAAAHNPVWIMRNKPGTSTSSVSAVVEPVETTVIDIKADKMPVGKHDRQNESFTLQEVDIQKGDVIYTLTDGFPDQFGGPFGKKFMSKKLRELLQTISQKPLNEQKEILEKTFTDWLGDLEQIDDVTLVGIRV